MLVQTLNDEQVRNLRIPLIRKSDFNPYCSNIGIAPRELESYRKELLDRLRNIFYQEMMHSDANAHLLNQRINKIERENGYSELLSYPVQVSMTMSNKCNAECLFCGYRHNHEIPRKYLPADIFKQFTWLKYVTKFVMFSGNSDSLTNPDFPSIYATVAEEYGHLDTHLQTNAINLNDRIVDLFAGHMGTLFISMHAATAQTWSKILQVPETKFDYVKKQLKKLADLKRARDSRKPKIILGFVINDLNRHEIAQFVELAHEIGVDKIRFVNVLTGHIDENEVKESLIIKQSYYAQMKQAIALAEQYGIELDRPALPGEEGEENKSEKFVVIKGTKKPVTDDYEGADSFLGCWDPWRVLGLNNHMQVRSCCKGVVFGYYELEQLVEGRFEKEIWNSETAQMFRKTVNVPGGNPLCTVCQSKVLSEPENGALHKRLRNEHLEKVQQEYKEKYGKEAPRSLEI